MAIGDLLLGARKIPPVDQVILRVLAAEVQRRRCPGCNKPLRQADISAHFSGVDKVLLHFRCRFCVFEGGGEIELTPEIYEEAARNAPSEVVAQDGSAEPISADEMLQVHELLTGWTGGFGDLLTPHQERQRK